MTAASDVFTPSNAFFRNALALLKQTKAGMLLFVNDENKFQRTIADGKLKLFLFSGQILKTPFSMLPALTSTADTPDEFVLAEPTAKIRASQTEIA